MRAAFEEFEFDSVRRDTRTRLRACLPDQAALHGVLERMRDLGVKILEVRVTSSTSLDRDDSHRASTRTMWTGTDSPAPGPTRLAPTSTSEGAQQ